MAKKINYKNLKINREELSTTKIGEINNQEKSPIFLFVMFGLFLAFIFFLPNVVQYMSDNGKNIFEGITGNTPSKKSEEEEKAPEQVYYDINNPGDITLEGLKVSNIKKGTNSLSFRVNNNSATKFYFNKFNYFLEIYTDNTTLLERVMMDKDSIARNSNKDYTYTIKNTTSASASKIAFVNKNTLDYPAITLKENTEGEQTLICKNANEVLTYTFKNDKLVTINDNVTYAQSNNALDYQNNLSLWQNRVGTYNNMSGVTSTILDNGGSFVASTNLNLKEVNLSNIDNKNYYAYETLAKVVSFELNSSGFTCE